MRRFSRNVVLNAAGLIPLISSWACSDLGNCPSAKPDITIETGATDKDAGTYQSAPIWGPRDAFPAMTTVHFMHHLGFVPELMQSFVSFLPENSNVTENAGNQGEWVCVDDEELILRNGTCQDFYVVVSAHGSGTQHAPCRCSERLEDGSCP